MQFSLLQQQYTYGIFFNNLILFHSINFWFEGRERIDFGKNIDFPRGGDDDKTKKGHDDKVRHEVTILKREISKEK